MKAKELRKELNSKNVYVELREGKNFKYDNAGGQLLIDSRLLIIEKDNNLKIIPFENIKWIDISDKEETKKWKYAKYLLGMLPTN